MKKTLYHDAVGVVVVDNSRIERNDTLAPAFGTLSIVSTPSGAKVSLQNDSRSYTTPCTIDHIPSGRYQVNVVAPQYEMFSKEVEIIEGRQTELVATLDSRFAEVSIHSLPNATIMINGQIKGYGSYTEALDEGIVQLEDGKSQIADGKSQIADAESEIADARKELSKIKYPVNYVLGRETNIGYACFDNDISIVDGIAKVFPIFFFMVAALVCMTTMSRMIEEQRTQIGVLKALGYDRKEILGKYIFYSGSSALVGGIGGFFFGTYVFSWIIWEALKTWRTRRESFSPASPTPSFFPTEASFAISASRQTSSSPRLLSAKVRAKALISS